MKDRVEIIYDGECPFCSAYVRMARLRENFEVTQTDARSDAARAADFRDRGYDLTHGMLVLLGDRIYYGADAVNVISLISARSGVLNRLVSSIFRSRRASAVLYPVMKLGRSAALALMGKSPQIHP